MGKGRGTLGTGENKTHTLCVRCGRHSFHLQKCHCSACAYLAAGKRIFNWSVKLIHRKTTGTGWMMYSAMYHANSRPTLEKVLMKLQEGSSSFS